MPLPSPLAETYADANLTYKTAFATPK